MILKVIVDQLRDKMVHWLMRTCWNHMTSCQSFALTVWISFSLSTDWRDGRSVVAKMCQSCFWVVLRNPAKPQTPQRTLCSSLVEGTASQIFANYEQQGSSFPCVPLEIRAAGSGKQDRDNVPSVCQDGVNQPHFSTVLRSFKDLSSDLTDLWCADCNSFFKKKKKQQCWQHADAENLPLRDQWISQGGGGDDRNSRGTTTKKLLMWPKKEIRFVLGCVCDESFAPERNTDSQCFVKTCHALNQRVQSSWGRVRTKSGSHEHQVSAASNHTD